MSDKQSLSELQQVAWESRGVRVSTSATEGQLKDFIQYKSDVPESPVNALRDELMEFIQNNRNRLSLPCDGDCYQHHDGVVLFCHSKFIEDTNGSNKEKTQIDQEDARIP